MVSIRQPDQARLRGTASSGTAAELANQWVKVQSIDTDHLIAHCVNQVKGTVQVQLVHMIGRGLGLPKVGETWLVSSLFGPWMFVAQASPSFPTLVEDDDLRLADTGWLTDGITGLNGNTVIGQAYRKIGHQIRVVVQFTLGSSFTTTSTGNVADTGVAQMPAGFLSSCPLPQALIGSGTTPILNGIITPAGTILYTSSQYPSAVFTAGSSLTIGGYYFD